MTSNQPPLPAQYTDSPLSKSQQIVLVIAPEWTSTTATLRRFERTDLVSGWRQVSVPVEVSLGRSGLAWGDSLHQPPQSATRGKREGDGCAPAGIFAITSLFGNAEQQSRFKHSARLPYFINHADLKCIDDPSSQHYNQIIDQSRTQPDWSSCEDMLRTDQRYAIGAIVAHNTEPAKPSAGSCIFIHVWENRGVPTAGCTAGSFADISDLCFWLNSAAAPLLVQLPQAEYDHFKDSWHLPWLECAT